MAFLDLLPTLTNTQWDAARDAAWYAAWDAARDAAWYAARDATRDAARGAARGAAWDVIKDDTGVAARDAAWYATWDAVRALLVRDLITTKQFDTLTAPMRAAGVNFDALSEGDRD